MEKKISFIIRIRDTVINEMQFVFFIEVQMRYSNTAAYYKILN
jgi:hypothetical protein